MSPDATPRIESAALPLLVGTDSPEISDQELAYIHQILLDSTGFNLEGYKDKCARRRIAIRIRGTYCESVREYCNLLATDKAEIYRLVKVLTIHVSQFFRNPPMYEKLRDDIIPRLFESAREQGKTGLRFWSLGCASGEEPYTLALILQEHFADAMKDLPVLIDATDVDEDTLRTAQRGVYGYDRLKEVPLDYIARYFEEDGHDYRLSPEIRKMVSFSKGEIFDGQLYKPCELLLCRNVLIYFSRKQQDKILGNIARVLGREGFLVLGGSETITGESRSLFQTIFPSERIFRPRAY